MKRYSHGYCAGISYNDEIYGQYECAYSGALETVTDETFVVPEQILGYPVTRIEAVTNGAGSMNQMKSAVISGTCLTIDENAFNGFTNLEQVDIQEGVQEVKSHAFANTGLKELQFPTTLDSYTSCLHNCQNLSDVYMPLEKINNFSFSDGGSHSQATLHVPYGAAQNYASWVPNEFAKIEEMKPVEIMATDVTLNNSKTGETTLSLNSTIPTDIVSIGFYVYAPDGITIEGVEGIEEAYSCGISDISMVYKESKKRYTISVRSLDADYYFAPMCQGEGFIGFLKLKIKASEDIEYNKEYTVELKKIEISHMGETLLDPIYADDTSFTVTVVNDNPTDIEEIVSDVNTDTVYNLSGIQISKILRKGIYIRNGKKVVVR